MSQIQAHRTNIRATPADIVAAMLGASSVTLRGFAPPPTMPSWLRASMTFVPPGVSSDDLLGEITARSSRSKWLRTVAYAQLAICALAAAFWGGTRWVRENAPAPALVWGVEAIGDKHVEVNLSGTRLSVFVGSRLPNGDLLKGTLPARNVYITSAATITLARPSQSPKQ